MATRAQQSDYLLSGIQDNSNGMPASGWWVSFHEAGNSIGVAGALTNTKNAYDDKDKTAAVTVKQLNTYGAVQVYMDGVYKVAVWDDTADPSSGATAVLKYEYDYVKYDFGVGGTVTKTADYTATTDNALILVDSSGGGVTVTLPTAVGVSNPIKIKKISSDATNVIVAAQPGQQIDDAASTSFTSPYFTVEATSDGSNWWGTASLTDASTLNGFSQSTTPAASKIVLSEGDGKINGGWIDTTDLNDLPSDNSWDGDGLSWNAGTTALDVNVDDSSIEIATDTLQLKDAGMLQQYFKSYTAGGTYPLLFGTVDPDSISGTYAKKFEARCPVGGTLQTVLRIRGGSEAGKTYYARIYVNGSAVGTERSVGDSTWSSWFTESIAVSAGDLIQVYMKISSGVVATAILMQIQLESDVWTIAPNNDVQPYASSDVY